MKPQTKWDRRNQRLRQLLHAKRMEQMHKQLVLPSKSDSKADRNAIRKARAWRMHGTFAVPAQRVRLSQIDWI
jgi:hypothetical protein